MVEDVHVGLPFSIKCLRAARSYLLELLLAFVTLLVRDEGLAVAHKVQAVEILEIGCSIGVTFLHLPRLLLTLELGGDRWRSKLPGTILLQLLGCPDAARILGHLAHFLAELGESGHNFLLVCLQALR